ncbi:uncharacterized protein [Amphiura filiformis]|uniref:uncharacterized protein n=1 Tax=Amphiura filiformis TaxID=82378 RepID=UPI003B216407
MAQMGLWIHDQTLKTVADGIMPFIEEANQESYIPPEDTNCMTTIKFRTADGVTYRNPALPLPKRDPTNLLQKANDWEFLMAEEHKQVVFPPIITETAKRCDITIYSEKTKTVIIIELTVQMDENLSNANARKKSKYQDLVADCENRGWCTTHR